MRKTSVVVSVNEDKSGLYAVEGRTSLQTTADFEADFKDAGSTPKEMVANLERQGKKDVLKTENLGFVGEGRQSNELHDLCRV